MPAVRAALVRVAAAFIPLVKVPVTAATLIGVPEAVAALVLVFGPAVVMIAVATRWLCRPHATAVWLIRVSATFAVVRLAGVAMAAAALLVGVPATAIRADRRPTGRVPLGHEAPPRNVIDQYQCADDGWLKPALRSIRADRNAADRTEL
jgi:hypothetical protein